MKQALFWKALKAGVECRLCPRGCRIPEGGTGYCRVRQNQKGRLVSLVYGRPCSLNTDPIEKKPLFHFAPGTRCLSLATVGCNLGCRHCQNWEVSHPDGIFGDRLSPAGVVSQAREAGVPGIAYTYTEPTVFFEYALDTMKLARRAGLYNVWVSNGYINPGPLKMAARYLDAVNLDLKGDGKFYKRVCGVPDHRPILEAAKLLRKRGVFLEATNLIIPGYNDRDSQIRELAAWVRKNLGPGTPLHFSRYYPCYKMEAPPTPVEALDRAWGIARRAGLSYVYVGNVPGHKGESTYCPGCGETVIKRTGYQIEFRTKKDKWDKCPGCGKKIPLAGKKWVKAKL